MVFNKALQTYNLGLAAILIPASFEQEQFVQVVYVAIKTASLWKPEQNAELQMKMSVILMSTALEKMKT